MASFRRLVAIARKEMRHITRDSGIFFLVTISPAFLLAILAYFFAFDLGRVNMAWMDDDNSQTSRALLAAITSDGVFRVTSLPGSYAQVERDLLSGRAEMAIVLQPGFESDLLAGRQASVQVVADGSDAITTAQSLANLSARLSAFATAKAAAGAGIQVRTRAWYNGGLKSMWSMVPGLMAVVLSLPALALTLAIKREEEVGTLEALVATPLRGAEFLLGKMSAYILSGLVSASLVAAVAVFWFHVPMRGSFGLFLLLSADFYLACMGISLIVAHFVSSQQTAMLLVLLIFFIPAFFICGLITPVNTSTLGSTLAAYVFPATHFISICRGVFLKGVGLAAMREPALWLAGLGVAGLSLSLGLSRRLVG